MDKNPSVSLEKFINFYKSNDCKVNDLVIKLASTPKVKEDILNFLLEEYYISELGIDKLLNTSICNKRTLECIIECIKNKKIDSHVLYNSIYLSIKTNNISSFYFLTSSLFCSDLYNKVKKYIKMYHFTELYGHCILHLESHDKNPFMHQLLKCNIPINKNILLWLASDKYYEILAECFKKECYNCDIEAIEIVFYVLIKNKDITKEESNLIIESIPSIDFIPMHIQNHLNYINSNDKCNNHFIIQLYDYYQTETLNKFTMYNVVNKIVKNINRFVYNLYQYFCSN